MSNDLILSAQTPNHKIIYISGYHSRDFPGTFPYEVQSRISKEKSVNMFRDFELNVTSFTKNSEINHSYDAFALQSLISLSNIAWPKFTSKHVNINYYDTFWFRRNYCANTGVYVVSVDNTIIAFWKEKNILKSKVEGFIDFVNSETEINATQYEKELNELISKSLQVLNTPTEVN